MKQTLLIELLTEELPPKALEKLSTTFADEIFGALKEQALASDESECTPYATPRRLAMAITLVAELQADRVIDRKGPAVASGLDAEGKPSKALEGFMRSANVTFEQLQRVSDGKAEYFVAKIEQKGKSLDDSLTDIVAQALKKLPIPKLMRWGDSDHQFVRPVHALTVLHGSRTILVEALGLQSGNVTSGHRFLAQDALTITRADDYENLLENEGHVIPSIAKRREIIAVKLDKHAESLNAIWVGHANFDIQKLLSLSNEDRSVLSTLLDEVTALVEWPEVYVGEFEQEYLEVPQECLILTMQQNQKYFPLLDNTGKLLNKFLIVSNMQIPDPHHIIEGNQRVVRPRLADARFFYNQDRKQKLEA
ncbi:MAG: glycine--tRNA ligase subunit beta, partial [Gallionellaceae bacterium]|nr:glycine--tRNA ligase subunit beta [Gallionellaceae bacterium]